MIFGVWAICHVSTLCICLSDYIAQLCHAVMDMSVDESYQLPTKGNDICLRAAKSVAASLQTPSEETSVFCDWLITKLWMGQQIVQVPTTGKSCGLNIVSYKSLQHLQKNGKAFCSQ